MIPLPKVTFSDAWFSGKRFRPVGSQTWLNRRGIGKPHNTITITREQADGEWEIENTCETHEPNLVGDEFLCAICKNKLVPIEFVVKEEGRKDQ